MPVQVDPATIAYLQDAVWVDRPARLFQNLLVTTLRRSRSGGWCSTCTAIRAATDRRLRGTLRDFGYDAQSEAVVVTFDAVRKSNGRQSETRRFSASVAVPAEAGPVGMALNEAANEVALEVAEWIGNSAARAARAKISAR